VPIQEAGKVVDQSKKQALEALATGGTAAATAFHVAHANVGAAQGQALDGAARDAMLINAPQGSIAATGAIIRPPGDRAQSFLTASAGTAQRDLARQGSIHADYMDQASAALPVIQAGADREIGFAKAAWQQQKDREEAAAALEREKMERQRQAWAREDAEIARADAQRAQAEQMWDDMLSGMMGGPAQPTAAPPTAATLRPRPRPDAIELRAANTPPVTPRPAVRPDAIELRAANTPPVAPWVPPPPPRPMVPATTTTGTTVPASPVTTPPRPAAGPRRTISAPGYSALAQTPPAPAAARSTGPRRTLSAPGYSNRDAAVDAGGTPNRPVFAGEQAWMNDPGLRQVYKAMFGDDNGLLSALDAWDEANAGPTAGDLYSQQKAELDLGALQSGYINYADAVAFERRQAEQDGRGPDRNRKVRFLDEVIADLGYKSPKWVNENIVGNTSAVIPGYRPAGDAQAKPAEEGTTGRPYDDAISTAEVARRERWTRNELAEGLSSLYLEKYGHDFPALIQLVMGMYGPALGGV
jgi:hypothetical protein